MPTAPSQVNWSANSLPAKHLIAVASYRKMAEAGIFTPEARIEISDTTARYDREVKAPLYTRYHIPEIGLIELQQRRLKVYLSPEVGKYQQVGVYQEGGVSPRAFPDLELSLTNLGWD